MAGVRRWRGAEGRDDRALVGVLDELLDLVGVEELGELLDARVLLVAGLHRQEVGVRVALGLLQGEGVLGRGELGLKGVVAVDDGGVHVVQGAGHGGGLQLLELQALLVGDVAQLGGGADAVLERDEAVLGEQLEGAAAVGGVVGDGYGLAGLDVLEVLDLLGVETQGLQVHVHDRDDGGVVLLVEVVQVGLVLEEVGVDLAGLGGGVRQDVVRELLDLQLEALLLRQVLLDEVQDVGVRRRGRGDDEGLGGVRLRPALALGGRVGVRTAGAQAEGEGGGGSDSCGDLDVLAHEKCLFLMVVRPDKEFGLGGDGKVQGAAA
ncbi:hypothetical protein Smic_11810 [Streptomyces microflavus]|uniref:Uncharacterized protein n=1 Tax=Streptomyces microflavus TaxID=1919 RepID=A0A7J0CLI1_STRMI|nr:hypothetical protein Smic_11810 [Streptomyces microflavus]